MIIFSPINLSFRPLVIYFPDLSRCPNLQVKRNTKFEKVFAAFYNKRGAAPGSYKFLIEGQRIQAENTPADYDIDNNDQIDALLEQVRINVI